MRVYARGLTVRFGGCYNVDSPPNASLLYTFSVEVGAPIRTQERLRIQSFHGPICRIELCDLNLNFPA